MSTYRMQYDPKERANNAPMRTIGELAEELGISMPLLRSLICRNDGPKPLKVGFASTVGGYRVYYKRAETLRWYAALKAQGLVKNVPPR